VANKVASESDRAFLAEQMPDFEVLAYLPVDARAMESDRLGQAVFRTAPELVTMAEGIVDRLASL